VASRVKRSDAPTTALARSLALATARQANVPASTLVQATTAHYSA